MSHFSFRQNYTSIFPLSSLHRTIVNLITYDYNIQVYLQNGHKWNEVFYEFLKWNGWQFFTESGMTELIFWQTHAAECCWID